MPRGKSNINHCGERFFVHEDGRKARLFTREWREGQDPRHEGLIYVAFQKWVRRNKDMPGYWDAVHPIWWGWTWPDGLNYRIAIVLGPGWVEKEK